MTTSNVNVALVAAALASSDTSGKVWEYRNLSDKEEDEMRHLVRKLYNMVAGADRSPKDHTDLPVWDKCGMKELETVLNRTLSALKRKGAADAGKVLAKVMQGLLSDIDAARDTEATTYAEWQNLSPSLQKKFPYTAPKSVEVKVSDLIRHFPQGTSVEQACSMLTTEGLINGGGTMLSRLGLTLAIPTIPNPAGKGRPISYIEGAVIHAPRVPASDANGSTLPHGNGQRVDLSQGQAAAAARAE